MFEELLGFLRSDRLPGLVESLVAELGGMGLSPRLVEQAGKQLLDGEQQWRPLLVDLVVGTQKARQLDKAREGWFYTARMAEQATHPDIARCHAKRLGAHEQVVEICTGAGHDTAALATECQRVISFEQDATVAAITIANLHRGGVGNVQVVPRPWTPDLSVEVMPGAVWADPARRDRGGQRTRSLDDHQPPPASILKWASATSPAMLVGIKLGPADDVTSLLDRSTSREYIGYGRECRELVLWRGLTSPEVTVTLVDQQASWSPVHREDRFASDPGSVRYLIEPHAAVIAAGEVDALFAELDVQPIDPQIAYGITGEEPASSPFYQSFQVIKIDQGVSEKRIRRRLEEFGWGQRTEFKKRGWPGDPESLRSLITDGEADRAGVVIIARTDQGHVTIYATRVEDRSR